MMSRLTELARLHGIQTSYIDMAKERRDADPEALLLVLRAMGAGVETFHDVAKERTAQPAIRGAGDGCVGWKTRQQTLRVGLSRN
jgi:hypothetical protein